MFLFGLIIGVAVGYLFKPQLDVLLGKIIRTIRENQDREMDKRNKDQDF
jgi:hypothetical protein